MSNLEKIKRLRQSTGAGFKDCSAAIEEASGDLDKAADIKHMSIPSCVVSDKKELYLPSIKTIL